MATCKSCGANVPEGAQFCPECGAAVPHGINLNKDGGSSNNNYNNNSGAGQTSQSGQNTYSYTGSTANGYNNNGSTSGSSWLGADHTPEFDYGDIMSNKWSHVLAYFGILFFLPLVVYPESRVGRFHANQGLVLLLFGVAVSIVTAIISSLTFIPGLGWILGLLSGFISWICGLAEFAAFIYAVVNIANNKAVEIPIIGRISLIK